MTGEDDRPARELRRDRRHLGRHARIGGQPESLVKRRTRRDNREPDAAGAGAICAGLKLQMVPDDLSRWLVVAGERQLRAADGGEIVGGRWPSDTGKGRPAQIEPESPAEA
jgi:hypothetical protein